jgi:hypothetical protein
LVLVFVDHRDELARLVSGYLTAAILKVQPIRLTRPRKRPMRAASAFPDKPEQPSDFAGVLDRTSFGLFLIASRSFFNFDISSKRQRHPKSTQICVSSSAAVPPLRIEHARNNAGAA